MVQNTIFLFPVNHTTTTWVIHKPFNFQIVVVVVRVNRSLYHKHQLLSFDNRAGQPFWLLGQQWVLRFYRRPGEAAAAAAGWSVLVSHLTGEENVWRDMRKKYLHISWIWTKAKFQLNVSVKPHRIQLYIKMTLKTLKQWIEWSYFITYLLVKWYFQDLWAGLRSWTGGSLPCVTQTLRQPADDRDEILLVSLIFIWNLLIQTQYKRAL